MAKKNKDKKSKKTEEVATNEEINTEVIVQPKISKLEQMKKDVKRFEALKKKIAVAKRNAISANQKLEKLLKEEEELELKYSL